ncbi:MAG: hypothetical protein JRF72_21350, partial [Deltaproteobacteria bacterium]|jgi:hypothetical protein|nr:hypothetical protein [Deltaproteobacteria bacterium]
MANALKFMPAVVADTGVIKKIRHGRELAPEDVNLERVFQQNNASHPYFKIIDSGSNLMAVIEYQKARNKLVYGYVFAN